jgi:hypothetical protein
LPCHTTTPSRSTTQTDRFAERHVEPDVHTHDRLLVNRLIRLDSNGVETGSDYPSWRYLSGVVRTKLRAGTEAALDPAFARNVEALKRVQPEDLPPSAMTARPGAPRVPAENVALFADGRRPEYVLGLTMRSRPTRMASPYPATFSPTHRMRSE